MMENDIKTSAELIAALMGNREMGTVKGILASEKAGQDTLVNSDILPREIGHMKSDSKAELESLGIQVTGVHDDLFYTVVLPDGWYKTGTDHSMWSELFDENGKQRASMFYKAAFYDRRAFIRIEE